MKAMIFAAGMGTRLQPYTLTMPKALVPVAGVPMLEVLIKHLMGQGISKIIVNVHHFADQVVAFIEKNQGFGAEIAFSHEDDYLLDTGGGLKKASWFFDDDKAFLVQNVDIICDLKYKEFFKSHQDSGAMATLAVSRRTSSRYFLFDDNMQLCGWENTKTSEVKMSRSGQGHLQRYAFSGIHAIEPDIFGYMNQEGKFSIVDTYLSLAADHRILGFEHDATNWADMGRPEELLKADRILKNHHEQ